MKKKVLTLLLSGMMIASVSACAGTENADNSAEEQSSETSAEISDNASTEEQDTTVNEKESDAEENETDNDGDGAESEIESAAESESAEESDQEVKTEDEAKSEEVNSTEYLSLYNEVLQKLVSGEEYFSGEGEAYEYSYASSPAYALYDIDNDGTDELFVTGESDREYYAYAVYYIKDGAAQYGQVINGYIPEDNQWIYGFDFLTSAYTFDPESGFTDAWEIDYPIEDDEAMTITYAGEEAKELTDSELNELLSKEIRSPEGLEWESFDESTDLTTVS